MWPSLGAGPCVVCPSTVAPSARVSPCVRSSLLHSWDHARSKVRTSNSDLRLLSVLSCSSSCPQPSLSGLAVTVQYSTYIISRRRVVDVDARRVRFLLPYPVSTDPRSTAVRVSIPRLPYRPYPTATLPTRTTTFALYPCPCPLPYTSSRYVTTVGDRRWSFGAPCVTHHP